MRNITRTEPPSQDQTINCDWCNEEMRESSAHILDNLETICDTCFEDCGSCEDCGCIDHVEQMHFHNDELHCDTCFSENYNSCNECENIEHNDDMHYSPIDDIARCSDCHTEHIDRSLLIKNYSYKPEPIFHSVYGFEKPHQGSKEKRLFFGFELEIERGENCGLDRLEIAEQINQLMHGCGMLDLLYFKWDSSLTDGFEVISHPMSYAFFKKHRNVFKRLLKMLRNYGVVSYKSGNCGLHIHLGRQAFTHSHFLKFQNFWNVEKNHSMLIKLSQRKYFGYCNLTNRGKAELVSMSKMKNEGYSSERSVALNCTNRKTIEVRIFRGTLNTTSFFKAFESVFAIFDYTKKMSFHSLQITRKSLSNDAKKVSDLIAQNGRLDGWIAPITEELIIRDYFFAYIKTQKKIFPNLNYFMENNFGNRWLIDSGKANVNRLNKMIKNERIYI